MKRPIWEIKSLINVMLDSLEAEEIEMIYNIVEKIYKEKEEK